MMMLIRAWPQHLVVVLEGYGLLCQVDFRATKQYVHLGYSHFESAFAILKRHMER